MAPGLVPRVFDLFMQADRSLEQTHGGLGIGLTLVQRLVEMHGGTVEARRDGPGKGSEFVVRLPVVLDAAQPQPAAISPKPAEPRGRRILIADDNIDSAEMLGAVLSLNGHQVTTAGDGLAALEAAVRMRPEAALIDIGMPRLNGYEVARRIRAERWGAGMLLIAVTGWNRERDRNRSFEAGFDAHLAKPVDMAALAQLLDSLAPSPLDAAVGVVGER
jgi:CheY-like chemotaxis protein